MSSSNTGSIVISRKSFLPLGANFVGKYILRMTKNPRDMMMSIYGGAKIFVENRHITYCMINKTENWGCLLLRWNQDTCFKGDTINHYNIFWGMKWLVIAKQTYLIV